jgi:hypothetical protein
MRHPLLILAATLVLAGCSTIQATGGGTGAAGGVLASTLPRPVRCTMPELPAAKAPDEREVAGRRGAPPAIPVLDFGSPVDGVDSEPVRYLRAAAPPPAPDGFPTVTTVYIASSPGAADAELLTTYTKGELGRGETVADVLKAGGAVLLQRATIGNDAALVRQTTGDKATIIDLGGQKAALVESTTMEGNFRSHNLYWSDGVLDYSLKSGGSFEDVVKLGQSMVCG